ncbi:MAG: N-acyl homoserine lactonase family protein [Pseudolysinimonas sp.]
MPAIGAVSVLSTGSVKIRPQHAESDGSPAAWWLFTSRRWTRDLPINVFVIEHDAGLVLFDAGQDRGSVTDPGYFPRGIAGFIFRRLARFSVGEDQTVVAGLLKLGYTAEQVHTVVLSHLHQDHIGGIADLPNARIVVSDAEWKQLDSPTAEITGFLIDHIRQPGLHWEFVTPQPSSDAHIAPFETAHDLFGDGSLLLLPTPGHTAGSLSMLVNRDGLPTLLLVGDLTYDVELLAAGRIPGLGQRGQVRRSSAAVLELQRRRPGLVILAAHDPAASSLLTRANGARANGAGA